MVGPDCLDQWDQRCRAALLMEARMEMRFLSGRAGIDLGSGEH
jgi:hypothetical protein